MYDGSGRPWIFTGATRQAPPAPPAEDLRGSGVVDRVLRGLGARSAVCLFGASAPHALYMVAKKSAGTTAAVVDDWAGRQWAEFAKAVGDSVLAHLDVRGPREVETFDPESFDFIFAPAPLDRKQIAACWGWLRPGGTLAVVDAGTALANFASDSRDPTALTSLADLPVPTLRKATAVDVTVVSTGFRAKTKVRCVNSVASQRGVRFEHVYVEAGDQTPPKTPLQNQYEAIVALPPERVVVLLDGDDWLATDRALERVFDEHTGGAWVTYGSFACSDGKPGFAAPVAGAPRSAPWTSTHLKSLRAGLVQRIRLADLHGPQGSKLRGEGGWLWAAADAALMLPCLEMAGADRSKFIADVLCVYEASGSWFVNAKPAERDLEAASARHIRKLQPYRRLEALT